MLTCAFSFHFKGKQFASANRVSGKPQVFEVLKGFVNANFEKGTQRILSAEEDG